MLIRRAGDIKERGGLLVKCRWEKEKCVQTKEDDTDMHQGKVNHAITYMDD